MNSQHIICSTDIVSSDSKVLSLVFISWASGRGVQHVKNPTPAVLQCFCREPCLTVTMINCLVKQKLRHTSVCVTHVCVCEGFQCECNANRCTLQRTALTGVYGAASLIPRVHRAKIRNWKKRGALCVNSCQNYQHPRYDLSLLLGPLCRV